MKININRITDKRINFIKNRYINKEVIAQCKLDGSYSDKYGTLEDITHNGIELRTGLSSVIHLPYSVIKYLKVKE
jgi:hypothetical protein